MMIQVGYIALPASVVIARATSRIIEYHAEMESALEETIEGLTRRPVTILNWVLRRNMTREQAEKFVDRALAGNFFSIREQLNWRYESQVHDLRVILAAAMNAEGHGDPILVSAVTAGKMTRLSSENPPPL